VAEGRPASSAAAFCAIAVWFAAGKRRHDESGGAPYAGVNAYGMGRAVKIAGSALHARVELFNDGLAFADGEYGVRTDQRAHAAAHALCRIQSQSNYVLQILHFQFRLLCTED